MRLITVAAMLISAMTLGIAQETSTGLTTVPSNHSVPATIEKLETAVRAKGLKVFARVDHAAAASEAGLSLPPTTVVIFGSPGPGVPLFLRAPTLALDLPLRALVWQDGAGKVSVTYNNGRYLIGSIFPRHGITPPAEAAVAQENLIAEIVKAATQ